MPVRFLHAFVQSLSTMALYREGHPQRERTIDRAYQALSDLLAVDGRPQFSVLGDETIYNQRALREMRDWEWASRLANAPMQFDDVRRARDQVQSVDVLRDQRKCVESSASLRLG